MVRRELVGCAMPGGDCVTMAIMPSLAFHAVWLMSMISIIITAYLITLHHFHRSRIVKWAMSVWAGVHPSSHVCLGRCPASHGRFWLCANIFDLLLSPASTTLQNLRGEFKEIWGWRTSKF